MHGVSYSVTKRVTFLTALLYPPSDHQGVIMPDRMLDQDTTKGAQETEDHKIPGNLGLQGQLGHRDQDPMIKGADTDFPEPGENPEHSGESIAKTA